MDLPENAQAGQLTSDQLQRIVDEIKNGPSSGSLAPFIGVLGWEGKPLTLQDHFQFGPLFTLDIPKNMILQCGRQEGKTMQIAARNNLLALSHPYLRQLIITPLFSQMQRYSREYTAGMLGESPFYSQFVDRHCRQTLMERTYTNGAAILFSHAYLDAVRLRSIPGIDLLHVDELQSMNPDFIPIAQSTMAASNDFQCTLYSGTPLSMDNESQVQWELSSMGYWTIMCNACRYENIASITADVLKMIGKHGPVCAKCGRPLNTREGYFLHTRPDRRTTYPGYNISQVIHPYHCERENKWETLLHYRDTWDTAKFVNEIIGGSYDSASQPLTMDQLKDCCDKTHPNTVEAAAELHRNAEFVILAVDWSGNGVSGQSTTGITCIARLAGDDRLWITYMERLPPTQDHTVDAIRIRELAGLLEVNMMAHDYTGAGDVRETTVRQQGLPHNATIIPISLTYAPKQRVMYLPPPSKNNGRRAYILDKGRALDYMYACMRKGHIVLPTYDTCKDMAGDFLNNAMETRELPRGSSYIQYIQRKGRTNDIAMSALLGLFTAWYRLRSIPNLSGPLSEEDFNDMDPDRYE